jgi:hypothetical protein
MSHLHSEPPLFHIWCSRALGIGVVLLYLGHICLRVVLWWGVLPPNPTLLTISGIAIAGSSILYLLHQWWYRHRYHHTDDVRVKSLSWGERLRLNSGLVCAILAAIGLLAGSVGWRIFLLGSVAIGLLMSTLPRSSKHSSLRLGRGEWRGLFIMSVCYMCAIAIFAGVLTLWGVW